MDEQYVRTDYKYVSLVSGQADLIQIQWKFYSALWSQTVIPFDNLSKEQMPLLKRRSNWELIREEMQTQSSGPRGVPVNKCVIFLKRIDSFYCLSLFIIPVNERNTYFHLFSILLLLFPFPRCQEHLNFIIFFCLISILRSRKRYFIELAVSYWNTTFYLHSTDILAQS